MRRSRMRAHHAAHAELGGNGGLELLGLVAGGHRTDADAVQRPLVGIDLLDERTEPGRARLRNVTGT